MRSRHRRATNRNMSKRLNSLSSFKWIVPTVALGFLAVIGLAFFAFKPKLIHLADERVKKACASCELKIGGLGFAFLGLKFTEVSFTGGEKGGQRVEAKVPIAIVSLRSLKLLEPHVTFFDGDKPPKEKKDAKDEDGETQKRSYRIVVRDGKFTYVRDTKGTHAVLEVLNIDGEMKWGRDPIPGRIRARVGERGQAEIKGLVYLDKKELEIETDWKVSDQDLSALTGFFKPNAGVELKGLLKRGHATTRMVGPRLTASLFAEFTDFELKVNKMYDRNGLQAFFMNLGTSIAMKEKNLKDAPEDKMKTVNLEREKDESIVSFILRGLKEAAIGVSL